MDKMLALSCLPLAVALSACSAIEDPVSRQLSWSSTDGWMDKVHLSQVRLQEGQSTESAENALQAWGWDEVDEIWPFHLERMKERPSDKVIVYAKNDSDFVCGLRRYVLIEHESGMIVSADGATGEAGCL